MTARFTYDWHDIKNLSNIAKHGLGFDEAVAVFLDEHQVDFDVSRPNDGEERRKVVGLIDGRLMTVVYTIRANVRWIISARRSNPQEVRRYVKR